jgi:hypothetical protein
MLEKVLKGRDKVVFENMGNSFKFKAVKGPYNGDIPIIPVTQDTIDVLNSTLLLEKKSNVSILDTAVFNSIRTALAHINISVIHASDSLDTFISLKDGVLESVRSDNFHLAMCTSICKTDYSFQLSPSDNVFELLGKLSDFYVGDTKVQLTQKAVKAQNECYSLSIATLQSSDTSFLRAKSFITSLPKPIGSCTLATDKMKSILDNILSIYEDGSLITIELKDSKKGEILELSMKSTIGAITDSIVVAKFKGQKFKSKFDPRMFIDSLALSKSTEIVLSYIEEKALTLRSKTEDTDLIYVNSVVND